MSSSGCIRRLLVSLAAWGAASVRVGEDGEFTVSGFNKEDDLRVLLQAANSAREASTTEETKAEKEVSTSEESKAEDAAEPSTSAEEVEKKDAAKTDAAKKVSTTDLPEKHEKKVSTTDLPVKHEKKEASTTGEPLKSKKRGDEAEEPTKKEKEKDDDEDKKKDVEEPKKEEKKKGDEDLTKKDKKKDDEDLTKKDKKKEDEDDKKKALEDEIKKIDEELKTATQKNKKKHDEEPKTEDKKKGDEEDKAATVETKTEKPVKHSGEPTEKPEAPMSGADSAKETKGPEAASAKDKDEKKKAADTESSTVKDGSRSGQTITIVKQSANAKAGSASELSPLVKERNEAAPTKPWHEIWCGDHCWAYALWMLFTYSLFLGFMAECLRRLGWGVPIFAGLVPLLMLPFILRHVRDAEPDVHVGFRLVMCIMGVWCLHYLRNAGLPEEKRSSFAIFAYKQLSCFEPHTQWFTLVSLGVALPVVYACLLASRANHHLTAFSGVLLLLTQPFTPSDVTVEGDFNDMVWLVKKSHVVQFVYNLGFTLWSGCFAFDMAAYEIGALTNVATCLAAWLFFGGWQPQLWVQARIHALFVHVMFVVLIGEDAFHALMPNIVEDISPFKRAVLHYVTFAVCALGAVLKIWRV